MIILAYCNNTWINRYSAGHYVYLEGSIGMSGDKANLISPEMPPGQEACISFWYNMHGQNIGELSVLIKVHVQFSCIT